VEGVPMSLCPSSDFGDVGALGEESEGEHAVIGVGGSLFGTRIGQGFEGGRKGLKGRRGQGKLPCKWDKTAKCQRLLRRKQPFVKKSPKKNLQVALGGDEGIVRPCKKSLSQ
jgi:hypothetical protein